MAKGAARSGQVAPGNSQYEEFLVSVMMATGAFRDQAQSSKKKGGGNP